MFTGKIGILGSGALGAFYGARLSRAGNDVHFLMRRDFDAVRRSGLRIKSFEGDFEIHPHVYVTPESLGICDLVIISIKTTDNASLPSLLKPTVGPNTLVLTLQNGLGNEDAIASVLGSSENILGGIAFLCSNRTGPGEIHHMDHGWIRLGEYSGAPRDRTHAIAGLFNAAGVRCQVYDSLLQARWEKLVWNVPFNGLGVAAHSADTAAVLADENLRSVARGLMEEVIAAAKADGVTLDPTIADKMMKNTESMGPYKTSMQLDYEAARPLEVEAIIGEPLRRARRAGIPTPRLEMLYAIVTNSAAERRE